MKNRKDKRKLELLQKLQHGIPHVTRYIMLGVALGVTLYMSLFRVTVLGAEDKTCSAHQEHDEACGYIEGETACSHTCELCKDTENKADTDVLKTVSGNKTDVVTTVSENKTDVLTTVSGNNALTQTITEFTGFAKGGFTPLQTITVTEKSTVESIGLPTTIPVVIDGVGASQLPVTWVSADGSDYEATQYETYDFMAVWDKSVYQLSGELGDWDIPYITVNIGGTLKSGSRSETTIGGLTFTYNNADGKSSVAKNGDDTITLAAGGTYEITGTWNGTITGNYVVNIASGTETDKTNVMLNNVTINLSGKGAFSIAGVGEVCITLKGANEFRSSSSTTAALHVPSEAKLVLQCENVGTDNHVCNDSCGKLSATGQDLGAGIGGGSHGDGGTVTINGGIVTASSHDGAGIGGGKSTTTILKGDGGTVTINGGIVTATSQALGAGIGGGSCGDGGTVTINGGTVTATGGRQAAGIGSGQGDQDGGGTVTINGGTVTVTSGEYGEGIIGSIVTITGGNVTATGRYGEGIEGGIVTITGGIVTAQGVDYFKDIKGEGSSKIDGNAVVYMNQSGFNGLACSGGIVFVGDSGALYGDVTLGMDTEILSGKTLAISPDKTLTIPAGVTLTVSGAITNNGIIVNNGTIIINSGGTITNKGTVVDNGTILPVGTVISGLLKLTVTPPVFSPFAVGGALPAAAPITITNTGTVDTAIRNVEVTEDVSNAFTLTNTESLEYPVSMASGNSINSWTLQPKANLAVGTYTGVIKVTYVYTDSQGYVIGEVTTTANVVFTVVSAPSPANPGDGSGTSQSGSSDNSNSQSSSGSIGSTGSITQSVSPSATGIVVSPLSLADLGLGAGGQNGSNAGSGKTNRTAASDKDGKSDAASDTETEAGVAGVLRSDAESGADSDEASTAGKDSDSDTVAASTQNSALSAESEKDNESAFPTWLYFLIIAAAAGIISVWAYHRWKQQQNQL